VSVVTRCITEQLRGKCFTFHVKCFVQSVVILVEMCQKCFVILVEMCQKCFVQSVVIFVEMCQTCFVQSVVILVEMCQKCFVQSVVILVEMCQKCRKCGKRLGKCALHIYIWRISFAWEKFVKVKCTLVQALRLCTGRAAHRGSRGIALPFHDHGTRRE
jgi:hypothetical protein